VLEKAGVKVVTAVGGKEKDEGQRPMLVLLEEKEGEAAGEWEVTISRYCSFVAA
jgi:hypothetical protein